MKVGTRSVASLTNATDRPSPLIRGDVTAAPAPPVPAALGLASVMVPFCAPPLLS